MDNNYYPDVDQQPDQAEGAGGDEEQKQPEGETALVPKSLFGGMEVQPGQEITLKVVATHEDEVEVSASSKGDEEEPGGSEMDQASGKLNALAQP